MERCKCGWKIHAINGAAAKCGKCGCISGDKNEPQSSIDIEAIKARAMRERRLISWLTFFRLPTDQGIGDTAQRLNKQSCRSPDAHRELKRLLSKCSCRPEEAVAKLNREHPYG